jgi:hypothetical protein
MVETLTHILELYRRIEAAGSGRDTVSLRDNVERLQKAAGEIGLVAIADVAQEIGHAVDLGRGETALHDVPRLQQKIKATWNALAKSFPNLSI